MMAQADRSINSIFDGGDSSVDVLLTILALAAPVGRRAGVGVSSRNAGHRLRDGQVQVPLRSAIGESFTGALVFCALGCHSSRVEATTDRAAYTGVASICRPPTGRLTS
jgi:hypothetical protein